MIFDHVGLVVADLETGRERLSGLFPIAGWTKCHFDPLQRVHVMFGRERSGIIYELISPSDGDSPVSRVLSTGKNIINHVAYRCSDLEAGIGHMRDQRAIPLGPPVPAVAFGGARIIFFQTSLGFVTELIEGLGPYHPACDDSPESSTLKET